MEFFRKFIGSFSKIEVEIVADPIQIRIEGSDESGWGNARPYSCEAVIPEGCTKLSIEGGHKLTLVARINPQGGISDIEIPNKEDIIRGGETVLDDRILLAVPSPTWILTKDGRLYRNFLDNEYLLSGNSSSQEVRSRFMKLTGSYLRTHSLLRK